MQTSDQLRSILRRIDHRGYKAYKDIEGVYDFGTFILFIDHVQSDPFAPPSRVRVRVNQTRAAFSEDTYKNKSREIALRDYITRVFYKNIERYSRGHRGSGSSGVFSIVRPGQEIIERTAVVINTQFIEVRFGIGLPAFGRTISASAAEQMFFRELPEIVNRTLFFVSLNKKELYSFIETAEDADFIREKLNERGLVAFVADGSILPRASGIDPRPLTGENVVPFVSPDSLRIEFEVPNKGRITGMGIREGITLIVGGGFHGKSTLLGAIELGIYNHIPGDGREYVVSNFNTMKIRAEDGRCIEKVDISPFINNLPFEKNTRIFSTPNASGSTSQAANIVEAVEAGARVLLMDEDTCATNFMIRDHKMQELVSKDKEPITPFVDKVRQLYKDYGVSTILVMGGSGDYLSVADTVICMIDYRPYDFTVKAKQIIQKYGVDRQPEGGEKFGEIKRRIPLPLGIDPSRGKKPIKIKAQGVKTIQFGKYTIDLTSIEQLVEAGQTLAIAYAILYAKRYMDGRRNVREILDKVQEDIAQNGLDILLSYPTGSFASFRALDLAAALNRLRSLRIK